MPLTIRFFDLKFFRVKRRFCRHITVSEGIAVRTHGWHRSGTVKLSKLVTGTAWLAGWTAGSKYKSKQYKPVEQTSYKHCTAGSKCKSKQYKRVEQTSYKH